MDQVKGNRGHSKYQLEVELQAYHQIPLAVFSVSQRPCQVFD